MNNLPAAQTPFDTLTEVTHDHDLITGHGTIRKRDKAASWKFRGRYGHTRSVPRRTSRGDAAGTPVRVDTRDMIEVHRVFRREFGLTPARVRATAAGDLAGAQTVAGHIDRMSRLAIHHGEEDRQLRPKLARRVPEQIGPVVALMEPSTTRSAKPASRLRRCCPG